MKNAKILLIVLTLLLGVSLSCTFLKEKVAKKTSDAPVVDFTTPSDGMNVKVELDKKQTSSQKLGKTGGSVSLTSADGSKFTLEVPANALDAETEITMTAIKTLDGAPLDSNTPTAVQLGPSGLLFNEMLTLTIVPAKEVPLEKQVMFGYEGEGEDYHMAPVDPKSKEIKIKLMSFSGAGVGSASDSAWTANMMLHASNASTRLRQEFAKATQTARREALLGNESGTTEELVAPFVKDFIDQVVLVEMAAAMVDCRNAKKALHDLIFIERQTQLAGLADSGVGSPKFKERTDKLLEIGKECKKPAAFQIVGGLDDFQTSTKVCDIMMPFTLTGGGFTNKFSGGMSGTYNFTGPYQSEGSGTYSISLPEGVDKPGTMTGQGSGTVLGKYSRSGTEKYTLTPIPPCG